MGMENTSIFAVSSFQYLILAFAFSQGPPYRTRIWRNVPFLVSLLILTATTFLVVINPSLWLVTSFEMAIYDESWGEKNLVPAELGVPLQYRWLIMGIVAIQLLIAIFIEDVLIKEWSKIKKFESLYSYKNRV